MSRAAVSVMVFGVYLVVLGLGLLAAPNLVLGIVGIAATREVWIRVIGALVVAIGYYYLGAARGNVTAFHRWTVHGRTGAALCLIAFAALGWGDPMLVAFAAVDLSGALWTWMALRRDALRAG
jgi:hypothetical protein